MWSSGTMLTALSVVLSSAHVYKLPHHLDTEITLWFSISGHRIERMIPEFLGILHGECRQSETTKTQTHTKAPNYNSYKTDSTFSFCAQNASWALKLLYIFYLNETTYRSSTQNANAATALDRASSVFISLLMSTINRKGRHKWSQSM